MKGKLASCAWGAAVASIVLLAALFATRRTTDFDVLWHVRTGQWILAERAVPTTDPFGAITGGHPWLDVAWGAQVPMALAFAAVGIAGLHLTMIALVAATIAVLLVRTSRTPVVLLAGLLLVLTAWPRFLVRPDVLALPLTVVLCWLIDRLPGAPRNATLGLVALTLVWTNLHGSFILVPLFLGAATLGALVARASRRHLPAFGAALCACLFVSLVNPRGPGIGAVFSPYVNSFLAALGLAAPNKAIEISEWIPTWQAVSANIEFPWAPFLLLSALLPVSFARCGRGWSAGRLAMSAAAVALGVLAIRNQLVFATTTFCVIAMNERDRLRREPSEMFAFADAAVFRAVFAAAIAVASGLLAGQLLTDGFYVRRGLTYTTGVGFDLDLTPEGAVRWLAEHRYPGIVFNNFDGGAYLFFRLYPRFRPYVDARVVDAGFVHDIRQAIVDGRALDDRVLRDGIGTVVLFHPSSESALVLKHFMADPRWRLAFRDHNVTIQVRTDFPPPAPREPPWPLAPQNEALAVAVNGALAPFKRHAVPMAELIDGFVSSLLGDEARELDAYRRALTRVPGDPTALAFFSSREASPPIVPERAPGP